MPGIDSLIAAFTEANPNVHVELETAPSGDEGNNLIRTKLATGEMNDIFMYNSGALLKNLNPDETLADLSDQEWAGTLIDAMSSVVSTDKGLYGAPWGSAQAGGVLYNKKVYEELGLSVPKTWDEFAKNNAAIKAAGKVPLIQAYGDAWTSQIMVYGNFANVLAKDASWASEWVSGQRKFADQPALQGYLNLEAAAKAGWFNKDFASATNDEAMALLASGDGVQYPMLTGAISNVEQNNPDAADDISVFPLPVTDAADTPRLTLWLPSAFYIAKSSTGAKLEAAKKFLAFTFSAKGCAIQTEEMSVSGPLTTSACGTTESSRTIVKDMQPYFDQGLAAPALEFLASEPIVLNNHEKITVEIGSKIVSGTEGAALADKAAELSAQTQGLPGW